jgi:phosphoribosylaminoimidazole-succinocarboxamide synthase
MERNFQGQSGQQVPEMPEDFVQQVSERYIELFEKITGEKFIRADITDVSARIERNITTFLKDYLK